jgi:cell shape-determining protein MreC
MRPSGFPVATAYDSTAPSTAPITEVIADSSAELTKYERVELLHSVLTAPKSNPPDES